MADTAPIVRTWTEPDVEARKDPRHQVLTDALRNAGRRAPADRIWGRFYGQTAEVGAEGNVWAGDPEDVADVLVRALQAQEAADREAYRQQLRALPEDQLHRDRAHPDWEYATTEGPRKQWYDEDVPPEGEGWVRNVEAGRDGWDRFDYTEESYWRRPRAATSG